MNNFRKGWYVIYTRPHHERKVSGKLLEGKIDCFLPTVKTIKVLPDRKRYIDTPLFPSYIFVYLNDMENYYSGLKAEGAIQYVRMGKDVARVNESIINNLKTLVSNTGNIEVTHIFFEPGRQLVIQNGPLCGMSCEVVLHNSKQKILVRMSFLNRNVLAHIPYEMVI